MFDRNDLENVNVNDLDGNDEIMDFVQCCSHMCRNLCKIYADPTITLYGLGFTADLTVIQIKTKFATLRTKLKAAIDLVNG